MFILLKQNVLSFRMRRQMLTPSTKGQGRSGMLAALNTVQPAPDGLRWLHMRMQSTDHCHWNKLIEEGDSVRARFFRGTFGRVLREDLELYLDACVEKNPPLLSRTADTLSAILAEESPLTTEILQSKMRISRASLREALVELQRNQLVVEMPQDTWIPTGSLITRGSLDEIQRNTARAELISRFLSTFGPASLREIADWSGWSLGAVKTATDRLLADEAVMPCQLDIDLQTRFVRQADVPEIENAGPPEHCLSFLACYDPIVRAQQAELKRRYGYGCSIPAFWHYILVDGEWCGALRIHYKMKMLWIRDMMLDGSIMVDSKLLQEIFEAIRSELTAGLHSIRIDWINDDPADSSVNSTLLSEHGYAAKDGAYILDIGST